MEIVFLDTETTGLDPAIDQVIEYTFKTYSVDWKGDGGTLQFGNLTNGVSRVVMPTVPVSEGAAKVNGYTEEGWRRRNATPWDESDGVAIFPFLYAPFVAGWNPQFDISFLERDCYQHPREQKEMPRRRVIDVMAMATPLLLFQEVPNLSLVTVATYFGLNTNDAHTSVGDVMMTIYCFERLVDYFGKGVFFDQLQAQQAQGAA